MSAMQTSFETRYNELLKAAVSSPPGKWKKLAERGFDPHQVDCLLAPEKYAPVWRVGDCGCREERPPCAARCLYDALKRDDSGNITVDREACVGCGECIGGCKAQNLTASKDILPALFAVKEAKGPVYAMIAPAFIGQFSREVTPGKLRGALKKIGFSGMVEVALFADILTLREALEFNRKVLTVRDFMLTSCCCPLWIAMIRKVYHQFIPYVPGAVSPMVACGRSLKLLEREAKTLFIGPCLAKKAEAKEKDIAGAVDFVLTFEEAKMIFDAFGIDPAKEEEDVREHSSRAGRVYAVTGGVSEAVASTVARLHPGREIAVRARQADGVPACRELLSALQEGKVEANFLEGMGCVGGCVGGPKAILNREEGSKKARGYADLAPHLTPADSPYVLELLSRLGFSSVEDLLSENNLFTRQF